MIAALIGYVDLSKALLRAGAHVHHAGIGSLTPLHLASQKGHAELVETLLRAGADPKAKVAHPPPRSTPLHTACRSTRLSCVVALLRGGADETMQDETPARQPHAGSAGPGAGGVGGDGDASAALEPPSTTPLDVIGLGRFELYQDPDARDGQGTETDEEHARRRNPETMELIRQALRRAPADRAWRRRSWLIMLRAAPMTQCYSVSSPVKTARFGRLGGAGLARWGGAEPRGGKEAKKETSGAALSENGAGMGKGKGKGKANPAAASKRAKHEDAGEGEEEEPVVAEVLVGVEADGKVSAGAGGGSGGGTLSSSCDAVGRLGDTEESAGEGGGSGSGDDGVGALRCLCGRLFGLADVEEGTFRRVVSYL